MLQAPMASWRRTAVFNPDFCLPPISQKWKYLTETHITALQADKANLENKAGISVNSHFSCTEAVCEVWIEI